MVLFGTEVVFVEVVVDPVIEVQVAVLVALMLLVIRLALLELLELRRRKK